MSVRAVAVAARRARSSEECVIMRLQGELGNQLFQFATGLSLSRRLGCPLRFDVEHHEPTVRHCVGDAFVLADDAQRWRCGELRGSPAEMWARSVQLRAWLPYRRARHRPERHLQLRDPFTLDPRFGQLEAPCWVRGYFQHLGYFADVLDEVVDLYLSHLVAETASELDPVVGLHFRRGDYLPRGWELGMGYYEAALEAVDAQVPGARLRVFADDAVFGELMAEHLRGQGRRAEVAQPGPGRVHPAVDALVDLARCRHLVLANSTFSWWAGALGDRLATRDRSGSSPRLVVTPACWRRDRPTPDLVRPGWLSLAG